MLWELHVKDLAVINDLRLGFDRGLTILSGDEGAGKSLLVDALCLLSGGKATTNLIRTGASKAAVEGIFGSEADNRDLLSLLEDNGIEAEADGTLIISREINEQGRNIARVNGRAVPVSVLRELGQQLIDIHSLMEHLSLLNSRHQMDLLDCYGGMASLRNEVRMKVGEFRHLSKELELLPGDSWQNEHDLLEHQIAEIDGANIQPGEDESLEQERRVLQRVQELKGYCHNAHAVLYAEEYSAIGLVQQAVKSLERAASIDQGLWQQLESIEAAAAELGEVARDLDAYMEKMDDGSERLQEVEERLTLLRQLKRKYGSTLEQVLKFLDNARQNLVDIDTGEERRRELEKERQGIKAEAGNLVDKLSRVREEEAGKLVNMVNMELVELGMPWTRFEIDITREEVRDGLPARGGNYSFTQHGIDRVQFTASTNPGEVMKPLADIASGGETCRFMLALKSALRQADSIPTLVFDEIDAGIGGRNADIVGKKLAALACERQVICITHLPQIACFGDSHYRVIKEINPEQSVTSIEQLQGDNRVHELAAMLGGIKKPMLESARELLAGARRDRSSVADIIEPKKRRGVQEVMR